MGTTMVYSGYVGIPGAQAFDAGSRVGSLCRGNCGYWCAGGGVGLRALGFTVQGLGFMPQFCMLLQALGTAASSLFRVSFYDV